MADDLYDHDFYAWTRAQAEALRARRSGQNALDYDNLAEEIEDVGSEVLHACESGVECIIEHLLKIEFIGTPNDLPHWRGELRVFRRDLNRRITPTIRNELRLEIGSSFAEVLEDLTTRELLSELIAQQARLRGPYSWEQLDDPHWYPEPREL